MSSPAMSPRVRGGVVGAASAATGALAHGAAHGMLPATDTLMVLGAAATAIGVVAGTWSRLPSLVTLVAGQGVIHLLLVLLSGAHHDLLTPTMALTHAAGTLVALGVLSAAETLAQAVVEFVVHTAALVGAAPRHRPARRRVDTRAATPPADFVLLGTVGLRAPPRSV